MNDQRRPLRHSLPFRHSACAMAVALVLGMAVSLGQIGYELVKARENLDGTLHGVLQTLEAPAVQAAYNLNRDMAASVVDGLFQFPSIHFAALSDNFGDVLAERSRPMREEPLRLLADWIVESDQEYAVDLYSSEIDRVVGRLVVRADASSAAMIVIKTTFLIVTLGVVRHMLLAATLAFLFFVTLTKPLMQLWQGVRGVSPGQWPDGPITLPCVGRPDEIGDLAVAVAGFMESAREHQRLSDEAQRRAVAETRLRYQAEAAVLERDARIRRLMDANVIGIMFWNFDGAITAANECFLDLVGYSRDDLLSGRVCWSDMTPEEFRAVDGEKIAELKATHTFQPYEKEFVRKDGARVPALLGGALFEGSGAEGVAFVLDLTERKQAEQCQKLLIDELNHRVKNTLAAVRAIAAQTLRTAETPEAFVNAFEARLHALSQAHNLLAEGNWRGASLRDVLRMELAPYAAAETSRFVLSGPDVHLNAKATVTLGMVFHELATNAAKYGALSQPSGRVELSWDTGPPDGRGRRLHVEWRESGGLPVQPPRRKGFGLRLVEMGLGAELGGRVSLEFPPDGMRCVMDLPTERFFLP